ncbi:retrovirus-related Pol polyprotein from transposon 17.6 [Elysia marginata]|uniref:Retrovirus-related Pol polyprotein from transposon 17.6 n=1 Tax=Elysia marginata TaxID=1093978 RepID=A0AAV4ECG8_9GAST|nr:retrovirus-related Pol polyprotein from transposon 17.6 [Elysia marginata]
MNIKFIASKRLQSLSRRQEGYPELKKAYDENLADMERSGNIREAISKAKDGPVIYLPHHLVVREDSRTTKVTPLFDAFAKGYNGVLLNDCLEAGPNLLPNILEVLLRFRRWKVAVTADVAKAIDKKLRDGTQGTFFIR